MLSEHKLLLRLAEVVAFAAVVASLYLGVKTYNDRSPDFPVLLTALGGMALLLVTFLPACMLAGEYVKTVRRPKTFRQRSRGLDTREFSAVLRWAPRFHLVVSVAGILILVVTAIKYGGIQFRSGEPPDPSKIPSLFFYLSVFYALALPVLASASRMPGSYASHSEA